MVEKRKKIYTVSEINRLIKNAIEEKINKVNVTGETSNVKYHSSGHLYFSLKDENNSVIRCVMFKYAVKKCPFKIKDGDKINVFGMVDVFTGGGYYQIKVFQMEQSGVGNLLLEFEKLKRKLEKEGLFDNKFKKSLPKFPKSIGVITSGTGAAIQDIKRVISTRFPLVQVILYPATVQGDKAKIEVVQGIEYFNKEKNIDLLIVGRGGGSLEDLWAFNEEVVARAIFKSGIPVISSVGHEIDFTIADFVADKRAATPSAAAEMAVPDAKAILNNLITFKSRLKNSLVKLIELKKRILKNLKENRYLRKPIILIEEKIQRVDLQKEYLVKALLNNLKDKKNKFNNLKDSYVLKNINIQIDLRNEKLEVYNRTLVKNINLILENKINKITNIKKSLNHLSPLNILKRGYSIVTSKDKIVTNSNALKVNDKINITFHKGKADAKVSKIVKPESREMEINFN